MRPLDLLGLKTSSRTRVFAFVCAWIIAGCCGSGSSGDPTPQADAAPSPSSPPPLAPMPTPTLTPAASALAPSQPGPVDELAPAQPEQGAREIAGAAHILVTYKGAENAPKTIARTKADARKRAEEALTQLKKDESKFAEVVKKYSDDPISKPAEGRLGNFERNAMPAAFSDACFAMKVDAISEIVESPRGFHIIKRTK